MKLKITAPAVDRRDDKGDYVADDLVELGLGDTNE